MPLVDTVDRTLQIKIVYYGPGLSGKTTTMETLSQQMDKSRRGDLMVLDTTGDRTLFFDWMPVDLGKIRGFDVKIQLYTVPGQVRYNNTRKQVLSGVDGIVFVADSQEDFIEQNKFSFNNLRENLAEQSIDLEDLPVVIQFNKRDLPNAMTVEDLSKRLNLAHYQYTQTVASTGEGVVETLRLITRLTLQSVKSALDPSNRQKSPKGPQTPLDGEALLAKIMTAESSAGTLEEATREAAAGIQETREAESWRDIAEGDDAAVGDDTAVGDDAAVGNDAAMGDDAAVGDTEKRSDTKEVNELKEGSKSEGESESEERNELEDRSEAAVSGDTHDEHEDSPYAEITAEISETGGPEIDEEHENQHQLITERLDKLGTLENELKALSKNLDELQDRLGSMVDKKLRALSQSSEDFESRMDVAQRILTSLGGRMAVVERRISRMEMSAQDPKKSDNLKEMSRMLIAFSKLLEKQAKHMAPNYGAGAEEAISEIDNKE